MCIGLSSVDHMPFIPASESPESDADVKMDLVYDSFVKEEIVDFDEDDDDNDDVNNEENNHITEVVEENPTIIQQPQMLKTTPRTVVISPKQSKGPIEISKHLSKPVFIPINLSNVKTIKVRKSYYYF